MKLKNLVMSLSLLSMSGSYANEVIPGEYIAKLKHQFSNAKLSFKHLKIKKNLFVGSNRYVVIKGDVSLKSLSKDSRFEYVEPNYKVYAIGNKSRPSADPRFDELWGLDNDGSHLTSNKSVAGADVNALKAWSITKGLKNIKIAVIDTGIDYNHEDLKSNIWTNQAELNGQPGVDDDGNGYIDDIHGYDFANDDGDPMDGNGHGTHCAGTIAATHDNNIGVAGVMANASLVGIKFLTDAGSGSTADAIEAINYATNLNVDIMSNSWGGGGFSQALKESIENARDKGIVFVAAAGNSRSNNDLNAQYPANYDVENVISVAAHNSSDQLASFSCFGARTVHVAAPGRDILSTTPGNSYASYSGTSMATPHVSGVIGLYLTHAGRQDLKGLRERLMSSSVFQRQYKGKLISAGRVDAYNLLTGTFPTRPALPDPNAWQSQLGLVMESDHPYKENVSRSQTVTINGAKFIRLKIQKFDLEMNYDKLIIRDKDNNEIDIVTGKGENHITDYVEGDKLTIEFTSDSSVNAWGFIINEVQFIK